MNKTGPKTETCGIPLLTSKKQEVEPATWTDCVLFVILFANQSHQFDLPECFRMFISHLWSTMSNVFDVSKNCDNIFCSPETLRTVLMVLCCFLKPEWNGDTSLFDLVNWSYKSHFYVLCRLAKIHKLEIDL